MRLFKKQYLEEVKCQVRTGAEVKRLSGCKRGRKVLLAEQPYGQVQTYLKVRRSAGIPIGSSVVMAAATGIITAYDRTLWSTEVMLSSPRPGLCHYSREWAM